MRTGLTAAGTAAILAITAPQVLAVQGQPLPSSSAVVVAWEAGSRSNVVVSTSGRVYAVHSLRRYRVGTRVRIRGVKWGRTGLGIKWGLNPRGIKWGIRLASNGTYKAGLAPMGTQRIMALRGVVLRRWSGRVAVSFRGAVIFLPISRGAVWLPGGTLTKAGTVGELGSKSVFTLNLANGAATVTGATQVAPPVPQASIPFAGKITSIDLTNGTIVVNATKNPNFPIVLTLTFPEGMDLTVFTVGSQIAGSFVKSQTGPEMFVTAISKNGSFSQADDPTTNHQAPAPNPLDLQAIKQLRLSWDAANTAKKFTQQGTGLYTSQRKQLALIERAIMRNQQQPLVLLKVKAFINRVKGAVPLPPPSNASGPPEIDLTYQTEVVAQAQALLAQLSD